MPSSALTITIALPLACHPEDEYFQAKTVPSVPTRVPEDILFAEHKTAEKCHASPWHFLNERIQ